MYANLHFEKNLDSSLLVEYKNPIDWIIRLISNLLIVIQYFILFPSCVYMLLTGLSSTCIMRGPNFSTVTVHNPVRLKKANDRC